MATGNAARGINTLFVGNLPWTIGSTELKKYFSQFGHIMEAAVIFNRETGMSKRYGFVKMADKNTFDSILTQQSHTLEGRILAVKRTTG